MLRRYPFLRRAPRASTAASAPRRTPFVFIGNNEYEMEGFAIGERARASTRGKLSLYVAQRPRPLRPAPARAARAFGRLRQARDFDALPRDRVRIETRHQRLHVATDGEVSGDGDAARIPHPPGGRCA